MTGHQVQKLAFGIGGGHHLHVGRHSAQSLRQLLMLHMLEHGNQQAVRASLFLQIPLNQGCVTAPLILHPDGLVILPLRGKRDHDLRALQGREDAGLVFLSGFQRLFREEHLVAAPCKLPVIIRRHTAVCRPLLPFLGSLVADEDVHRCLLAGDGKALYLNAVNQFALPDIEIPIQGVPGQVYGFLGIQVFAEFLQGQAVQGRKLLSCGRIRHILDSVFA